LPTGIIFKSFDVLAACRRRRKQRRNRGARRRPDVDHLRATRGAHRDVGVEPVNGRRSVHAQARRVFLPGLGAIPSVTGQGVGVAIVDSGIAPHTALGNRVVANVNFVSGETSATDVYGHGTHVAGIVSGSPADP
jgi:subtilisin family serine protease